MNVSREEHRSLRELIAPGARWLIVVAAPLEARAVRRGVHLPEEPAQVRWHAERLTEDADLLVTGVGKANAAAGLSCGFDPLVHHGVLGLGVAGALPSGDSELGNVRFDLAVGDSVAIGASCYADEGVRTVDGFTDIARMGFAPGEGLPETSGATGVRVMHDDAVTRVLARAAGFTGDAATVSTCSGTDELALAVARRSGGRVETMESAAIGFTLRRLSAERSAGTPGPLLGELRTISNFTGDRTHGAWDLRGAADRLSEMVAALFMRP